MGFWRGKKVLLTGHTGFKGGWAALWLASLGAHVVGFSLRPTQPDNLFSIARIKEKLVDLDGDVRDLAALQAAVHNHDPEIIIHMAAQALVHEGSRQPVDTFATNVMGTVNVLEAARRRAHLRAILIVTSDKCYNSDAGAGRGHREDDPLGGPDPYSSSKACAELVTAAYNRSYFAADRVGVATARAGNVLGGGDFAPDRLVPDVLAAISGRRKADIRSPTAVRPWQFVTDPVGGYMRLVERLAADPAGYGGGWNFGPTAGNSLPVAALCDRLCTLWGDGAAWAAQASDLPPERHVLTIDASKARAALNFETHVTVDRGLAATVDWHKAWRTGADMQDFTLRQIALLGAPHVAD